MKQSFTIHLNENSQVYDNDMNLLPAMLEVIIEGEIDLDIENAQYFMTPKIKLVYPEYPAENIKLDAVNVNAVTGVVTMGPGGGLG